MEIKGRRIHIAGSADTNCDLDNLKYAHDLIGLLSTTFSQRGASLCVQVGKEPHHQGDQALSIIFDWTVIQSVWNTDVFSPSNPNVLPLTTVITEKTDTHIPVARKELWQNILDKGYVQLLNHPRQWTAGAIRRDRLATTGDILVILSGGEGVEHLAQLYIAQRKPVIAFDLNLGASTEKGVGRAVAINREIAANPDIYLRPKQTETIGAMWENLSTRNGTRAIESVVESVLVLIEALEPPAAY